ncbi:hypothetical protein J7T55_000085 [Diaporthe amygdali]|uniref:uncharacterized protein n=1 Tax=Phomopsis amygdali TaxID=1214568 RepID=UPI0022FEC964|nr:uncharacterized protein J7T55_000085 [Diaporthe amygdali]KAJ0107822.1 hypothetical protein J7T55_000085 [Diaporthe amygdali]
MYEYQPLPEQDSIRILILAPGKDNDPLSGTLETTHVNNRQQTPHSAQRAPKRRKTSPAAQLPRWTAGRPFEAISYAWGSNMLDHAILLNGMAHQITANLNDALRQCRLPDQPRALWADSICINQNDLKEKGQQVAVMDRVYASSQCTLICLGTDTDNRDHAWDAFEVLSDANTMIQQALQSPGFSWELNSFPWPNFQDPLVKDSRWQSIKIMVDLPWFWRGWVVQEAALGREARILWAGCEILLLDLMRVELWFNRRVRELAGTSNHVSWWITKLVRQTLVHQRRAEARVFYDSECLMEDMDILETLDGARNLGLGDPRDRIYAFMALPFVKNPMPALRPDYEQSHLRLYRDFAVKYLEHTSDLNILCYVTHEVDDGQGPDSLESSWVPRWDHRNWVTSVRIIGQGYRFGSDSADSADFAIVHKNDLAPVLLKVRAVVFGLVGFVSQRFMQHSTAEDLTRVWSLASEGVPRASGREESDAFHEVWLSSRPCLSEPFQDLPRKIGMTP